MYWMKELIEMYGLKIFPFTPSILTTLLALNSNQEIESKMRNDFILFLYY